MGKGAALATSVTWFIATGGIGAVLIPWWLTGWQAQPLDTGAGLARAVGAVLIVLGLIPTVHVFVEFVRAGGTPMPGAMPARLVVTGFNRYVRNPIYLGALTIFVGEAVFLWQVSLLVYAVAAWLCIAGFVHWYEEPTLVRRFGADYVEYRRAVPAWIPRRHPWEGPDRRRVR
jgi:protein-S-isoprenylcysteine O-methyltransferase Ste14